MKTASFKLKSRENLVAFLKRFLSVEKFILLEITPKFIICKTNTGDRSTLKYSKIAIDNVLEGDVPGDIRVPIADAGKVEKILRQFAPADEIFIDVNYEESSDGYLVGHPNVTFRTDKLKINMPCGDISLVKFIAPDVLKKVIKAGSDAKDIEVTFKKEYFDEVQSLCGIDIEKDKLQFVVDKKGKFIVSGSNFDVNLDIVPVPPTANVKFRIKTSQFSYIDPETSTFEMGLQQLVIRSKESDTITVMSNIED